MEENRALVVDGGCILGAFAYGVLRFLYFVGLFPGYFKIFVGTSAGYFDLAYCLNDQWAEGYRMWTQHLLKGFIKRGLIPRFDLNYLESVLSDSPDSISTSRLRDSTNKIWLPVTNMDTLEADFHCLNESPDIINLKLGGCRLPWDPREIRINGNLVCDGGLVCQPPVEFAKKMGATEVWLVSPYKKMHRLNPIKHALAAPILGLVGHLEGQDHSKIIKLVRECPSLQNAVRGKIEGDADIKVIRPDSPLPIKWLSRDRAAVAQAILLGEEAAKKFVAGQKL